MLFADYRKIGEHCANMLQDFHLYLMENREIELEIRKVPGIRLATQYDRALKKRKIFDKIDIR